MKYINKRLTLEKVNFQKIAKKFGTPFYCYSYSKLKENINKFKKNFKSFSPLICFAVKSNTNVNLIREIKKLGFEKPTNNSIDTVADRDFVLDFLYSVSVCSLHLSRISEELIIWNSDGFNLINLSDKIVTGSSIMPQKKILIF